MYNEYIDNIEKLENIIEEYEKCSEDIKAIEKQIQEICNLENVLYVKYHTKYKFVNEEEVREYSKQELEEIKRELLDSSIVTILKRFLGIGRSKEVIYAELMGKIKGLKQHFEKQKNEVLKLQETTKQSIQQYGEEIQQTFHDIIRQTGYVNEDDWKTYKQEETEENHLYFGDVEILLESERSNSELILKESLGNYYKDDFVKIPYVLSGMKPFQFFCEYAEEKNNSLANGLMRSLIYQQIRQMKEYSLEIYLMDGENTGNDFSELLGLSQVRTNEVWQLNRKVTNCVHKCVQSHLDNQAIRNALRELDQYIGRVAETISGYQNVEEYNKTKGQEEGMIPLQMLVIQNFPIGFSDSDIELLNKLIKNGNSRGISIFIQYNSKNREFFEKKVNLPTNYIMDGIRLGENESFIQAKNCSSAIQLKTIDQAKGDYIQSFIDAKMKITEIDNKFLTHMRVDGPFGTKDATNGIIVPFALDRKGNIKSFTLANALNAHGLISGGTGAGKTSFIHMIISSVAMNYTPKDVEMWLIDYKVTEFGSYKYNTPPHVQFLGLSKGIDFTYALLDKIQQEYERRQQAIKRADEEMKRSGQRGNITSITDYRKYHGKDSMSRLLIIIDEFHVMAQQVNEDLYYKELLENLLSEGRAMGITFLFSDQAVTVGLKGLTEKGKKQIKCRLALANDKEEMKEMLQTRSEEDLKPFITMKTGECAIVTFEEVRSSDGALSEEMRIERVKNIYIDGEVRFDLCKNIREFYQEENYRPICMDENEKKYFDCAEVEQWEKNNLKRIDYSRQLYLYVGEAMNLTGCFAIPLLHRNGENVISVGGSEEQQKKLVFSYIRSMQRVPDYRIVVCIDKYSKLFDLIEKDLLDLQYNDNKIKICSELEDICLELNNLLEDVTDRKKENRTLVIWAAMEGLCEEFKNYSEKKPDCFGKKETRQKTKNELEALEDKWSSLFGEENFGDPFGDAFGDPFKENDSSYEEDDYDAENVYNATNDIVELLQAGPRRGVFNCVIYDTTYPVRNNRKIRMEDFKHKLAFAMGRDECFDYLGRQNLLDGLDSKKDIMAYYDGRDKVKKFILYQH